MKVKVEVIMEAVIMRELAIDIDSISGLTSSVLAEVIEKYKDGYFSFNKQETLKYGEVKGFQVKL